MTIRICVLTDGKIGDDVQCIAVAGALSANFAKIVISPRAPWNLIAPWGPPDPRDMARVKCAPQPDIVIVSGRRAIPCGRAIKTANAEKTRLVILKDPRFGRRAADFIWAPAHDGLRGANVFITATSPHGLAERILTARGHEPVGAKPILGVFLGGPSGGARYNRDSAADFARRLKTAGASYGSVVVTASRRTPDSFIDVLKDALGDDAWVWRGEEDNPYINILAHAQTLIVAGDSHNMVSEALSTQAGVYVWRPAGLSGKLVGFLDNMIDRNTLRAFDDAAPPFERSPIDATETIAAEIRRRFGLA